MNLYSVRYRMEVPVVPFSQAPGRYDWTTEQELEVQALSSLDAQLKTKMWLETTQLFWWKNEEGVQQAAIPNGSRKIRILECELLLEQIDFIAKDLDLPDITYHDSCQGRSL